MLWRVSGFGKENVIRFRKSRNSCYYQSGLTTHVSLENSHQVLSSDSNYYAFRWHRVNSCLHRTSIMMVLVHCVVNLCRWVPGLLSTQRMYSTTSQANQNSTTNWWVDTNSVSIHLLLWLTFLYSSQLIRDCCLDLKPNYPRDFLILRSMHALWQNIKEDPKTFN